MSAPSLHNQPLIIARIAAGDEQAFTQLFDHYRPYIYTYLYRMSRSETLAQEIVQDTFLKTWLKRQSLTGINNFAGWLFTIAGNIAYDALRKKTEERERHDKFVAVASPPPDTFTTTEEYLLREQYAELVENAIRTLPERQQEAFRLIKLQGLSREETAAAMGISPESVKTNLAIGLQKVRAYCLSNRGALGLLLFLWATR